MLNVYGFFYCHIDTSNTTCPYLGLLPIRSNIGITMPNGVWEEWYFSEELKLAQENSYIIKVIKGYHFYKV